jgi:hypothetical protein
MSDVLWLSAVVYRLHSERRPGDGRKRYPQMRRTGVEESAHLGKEAIFEV